MQTWAKRGIQTALVTGGLLMLGTGIASASENVNPDSPASPIDGGLTVPVDIGNNDLGTALGNHRLPEFHQTFSTDQIANMLPRTGGTAGTSAAPAALRRVAPAAAAAGGPLTGPLSNRLRGELVVPIQIENNAIGATGDAFAAGSANQNVSRPDPAVTGEHPSPLGDNVLAVNEVLPLQITGNAVGALGNAATHSMATQTGMTGGDINTNGAGSALAGNVLAWQGANPVQVNGNSVGAAGDTVAHSVASSTGYSAGHIGTSGKGGAASGNVGAVPEGLPVNVNNNSVGAVANTLATGWNQVTAKAGDQTQPTWRGPAYAATNGDTSALSGNLVTPQTAEPVSVMCNAVGAVATSLAGGCETAANTSAGGYELTSGTKAAGSGNLLTAPIDEPVQVFGNGVAAIANVLTNETNTDIAKSGGQTYTTGDQSVLSANSGAVPVGATNDVFGNGVSAIGSAVDKTTNTVTTNTGGYNGTTSNGAAGSGNVPNIPIAVPIEIDRNNAAGAGGGSSSSTSETKSVTTGGSANGSDDHAAASANVINTPVALPAQVFNNAVGAVADTFARGDNRTAVRSGGAAKTSGNSGAASGNIVQGAFADPVQVFDSAVSAVGNGAAIGTNTTWAGAGGAGLIPGDPTAGAQTSGTHSALDGNIVDLPDAGPVQVFGSTVTAAGSDLAGSANTTRAIAGGSDTTDGTLGALAGNVINPALTQNVQLFADNVGVLGNQIANAHNDTATKSGGDVATAGDFAALSGDILAAPVAALVHFGSDTVGVLDNSRTNAISRTFGETGGATSTSGDMNSLSGINEVLPVGVVLPFYKVPLDILGDALDTGQFSVTELVADQPAQISPNFGSQFGLPTNAADVTQAEQTLSLPAGADKLMGAGETPNLSTLPLSFPSLSGLSLSGMHTPTLPTGSGLSTQDAPAPMDLPLVGNLPLTGQLPVSGELPSTGQLPLAGSLPVGLPSVGGTKLPAVSSPVFDRLSGPLGEATSHLTNGPLNEATSHVVGGSALSGAGVSNVSLPKVGNLAGQLPTAGTPLSGNPLSGNPLSGVSSLPGAGGLTTLTGGLPTGLPHV
ncbi:MAG TPA: hypothetical protein VG317_15185 [Pseudonocardiaceae bacterium]|nr:hypothetical protein [Pseudonocardiaceae bacterium]